MKVNRIKLPPKGQIDTYFLASDWHSFYLHKPSFKILCKAALKIPKKHRKLIIDGDFLDAEHLMGKKDDFKRWIKAASGIEEYFLPLSQSEFAWGNEILDQLEKIFQSITFIAGNHENRYFTFMENHSPIAYQFNFCLPTQLRLKSRNILYVAYNDWVDLGKLSITHGMWCGATCLKKHFEACGKSLIIGHVHKFECKPFVHRGETKQAWSLPAMAGLNPEYIKNTDNNWSNGFGIVQMKHNGNFNCNIMQVWDNELVWPDGKIISGEG